MFDLGKPLHQPACLLSIFSSGMKLTPMDNSSDSSKEIHSDLDLEEWYTKHWSPPKAYRIKLWIIKYMHMAIEKAFEYAGLTGKGHQNALNLQIESKEFSFFNLPRNFHGIRILFLSDFHLGTPKELPDIIASKVKYLEVDLCLLGGDYRHCATRPSRPFLNDMKKIISNIRAPLGIYGVLGNHDGPELIPALERMGIKILLNESISIVNGNHRFNLIGVDDFYSFRRHDVNKAFNGVPPDEFNLFLAHSPDLFQQAQAHGADLYLCGHTHHGQVQLPCIGPVFMATSAPREFSAGHWQYKTMTGYTSPGLGTVAAPVRFRCPPKAVVLTLNNHH